jgi:hypothetical protein
VAGKRKTPKAVTLGVLAFGPGFCYSAEKKSSPEGTLSQLLKKCRAFLEDAKSCWSMGYAVCHFGRRGVAH